MIAGDLPESVLAAVMLGPAVSAVVALGMLRSRSRKIRALNRSLHEVRRPLQVLALAIPDGRPAAAPGSIGTPAAGRRAAQWQRVSTEPLRQAISALSVLDQQINGGSVRTPGVRRTELVAVRLMADSCVRRWVPFARLAGSELRMVWTGPDDLVRGDGTALAAALENLISNSIEHGGDTIEVSGMAIGRKVRLVVTDTGVASDGGGGLPERPALLNDLDGIAGHGHGLEVVAETVSAHGGKLETEFGDSRSEAVIVLPVSPARRSGQGVKVNW